MNYIEANIIISQIVDAYAFKHYNSFYGVPQSKLPFYTENWKTDLTVSASLFVSHAVLWNDYDGDWVKQMFGVLKSFSIVPDEYAMEWENALDITDKADESPFYAKTHRRKVDEANAFMNKNLQLPSFNTKPIINAYNHMIVFFDQVTCPDDNNGVPLEKVVHDYVVELYSFIGCPYKEEYDYYFYTFDQAREWLEDPIMKKYFLPYKNHLLTHKK